MKYTIKQYAHTLLAALRGKNEQEQKDILRNFLVTLSRNGDWLHLRDILRNVEKKYYSDSKLKKVEVETPSEASEKVKNAVHTILGDDIHLELTQKPELVAGMKIIIDDEILIDATAKHIIEQIF